MKNPNFEINDDILQAIDDYHVKSLAMQKYLFEGNKEGLTLEELADKVNDDLVFHVPIYDMLDRKYAAFSSFLEAVKAEHDPKGNSKYFPKLELSTKEWILLFYLFRLCGSGINYKPKPPECVFFGESEPFGSHGFGNFWIIDELRKGRLEPYQWFETLEGLDKPFTDNKGYMLPQVSYPDLSSGHLKKFILEESYAIVQYIYEFISVPFQNAGIIDIIDAGNEYMMNKGFKRQNFVLAATASDIAEYFPNLVDPKSMIHPGTNARQCLNLIFTKTKGTPRTEFEHSAIQFLADRYESTPYSVEDSRLCDMVRYLKEFQSPQHVAQNSGKVYKNNSILKQLWGNDKYYAYTEKL